MKLLRACEDGVEVEVWVVPGASRSEIAGTYGGALRVRVAAPPEGGRANKAVEAVLSKATGGKVRLLAGASSRRKRLLVEGLNLRQVSSALGLD